MFLAGIADYPKTLAKVIHPVFCNLCWKMFTYSLTRMMGQFDLLCNLALYPTHPRVLSCGVFWTPTPSPLLCLDRQCPRPTDDHQGDNPSPILPVTQHLHSVTAKSGGSMVEERGSGGPKDIGH